MKMQSSSMNNNKQTAIAKKAKKKLLKRKLKIGENEKEVIRMIGLGTLTIAAIFLPGMSVVLKAFLKDQGKSGLKKLLDKLIEKKIIVLGGEEVNLTVRGLQIYREIQVRDIQIPKPAKWDGVWHLVSYDIPKKLNKARDNFRLTLKNWDFYQIQDSLWVFPYECREEVAVLAEYLGVAEYVIMMNTDVLPNEEEVENYYEL